MSGGGSRPTVLVGVHTDLIGRDLMSSGILAALSARYDLRFVVIPSVAAGLEKIGAVAGRYRHSRVRYWIWHCLWILGSIRAWEPVTGRLSRDYFNRKKTDNYSLLVKLLVFSNRIGLAPALMALAQFLLNVTVDRAMGGDLGHADVVIAPTGLRDFTGDDLVRWGVRRRVPTVFLQINSDVFNMKTPTARPAYFAIWGDQSWYMARLVCHFSPARLRIVGSPRFDIYEQQRVPKSRARGLLDVPDDALVVLFCGGTAAFDETRALGQIEQAIADGLLPSNMVVLYKAHPKGQVKGATSAFEPAMFKHVQPIPGTLKGQWSSLDIYPVLLNAADALISPYSTMGVEGALHGLPVLALGYHPGRFESYWRWAREFTHLQIYRDKIWAITCDRDEDFMPGVQALLKLVGDPAVAEAARNEVRAVAIRDGRTFPERLAEVIDEVVAKGTWTPA